MNVEIQLSLTQKSDRVKSIDCHPTQPWALLCLFSGKAIVYDTEKKEIRNHFEPGHQPIRCGKFIARKQWVVFGCDDLNIRVYNYNTGEKVKEWKAHDDFIRGMDVHDTLPYLLTCSDDMLIKLWDWDHDFQLVRKYEGHVYYIMAVKFNPKDSNTFASVSLDRSIKMWSINKSKSNYSMIGHQKGINCLDFYPGTDKPYIATGSDDLTVKIWDYQTKTCVQTLTGFEDNVTAVCFHPHLPYIFACGEDNRLIIFHSGNYRRERVITQPTLDRMWSVSMSVYDNSMVCGYDEGYCVYNIGRSMPAVSMDMQGKVIWAVRQEIKLGVTDEERMNLTAMEVKGEEVPLIVKEYLGRCEVTPSIVQHNRNGRFLAVVGEGDYVVYTSRQLRSKAFGEGTDFVWRDDSNGYCVRINENTMKIYSDFKESHTLVLPCHITSLFGGPLLGVTCNDEFMALYDWATSKLVTRIDAQVTGVAWSEDATRAAVHTLSSTFILCYHADRAAAALANNAMGGGDGVVEVEQELEGAGYVGTWYKDAYIYVTNNKLRVLVGTHCDVMSFVPPHRTLLKYIPSMNAVFFIDSKHSLYAYSIDHLLMDYECAVTRQDFDLANSILPSLPASRHDTLARFLDFNGFTDGALQLAQDPELRFDLALKVENMDICIQLLQGELSSADSSDTYNPQRWRRLADLCISRGDVSVAQKCADVAGDLSLSLLLLSCIGDRTGLHALAQKAQQQNQLNIAFLALYITGDATACMALLTSCCKLPEAAFFSMSYVPSQAEMALHAWQEDLRKHNHIAAELLANPVLYAQYFPGFARAIEMEKLLKPLERMNIAAGDYRTYKDMIEGTGLDISMLHVVKEQKSDTVIVSAEDAVEKKEDKSESIYSEKDAANEEIVEKEEEKSESICTDEDAIEKEIGSSVNEDEDEIDIDSLEREWND